jgi:hypothetical protein
MERLWSPGVATGGNQWEIERARKARKQAKTVAKGCHRLPETFHGKEGVSGSSPEEGLCKSAARRRFLVQIDLLSVDRTVGMGPFMELSS